MPRINEHTFKLKNEEYLLSYYDKPKVTKNGVEQKVLPVLREYISNEKLPIQLVNKNGREEVTYTLARKILEYFSNQSFKKDSIGKGSEKISKTPKIKEVPQKIKHVEKLELSENFKVVMICSSGKNDSTLDDYPKIKFKAIGNFIDEFHPDEKLPNSTISWRDYLEEHQNDKNLLMAYQLYKRNEYRQLYEKFGNSFYILSAGWGLVSSEFKLPNYDITFSGNANVNIDARRIKNINNLPIYNDFNQLDINDNEDIIFIGSPDYIQLFIILTQNLPNRKIIYWKSKSLRRIYPNDTFEYRYFQTNTRTNWHYELACAIAYGIIP
jgi:hypothetical protein